MPDVGLESYRSDARRYDELLDSDGHVRSHWRALIHALTADDAAAVRHGVETSRRLIVENGVTYNVYADPQGRDRPWILDPLPVLLTGEEWREIEAGVAQRARLFDALLGDLYGAQRLLADGTVPAELPFGHPNFLWPCHGMKPHADRWLHVYAVDISRSVDGTWWALADRTQAPSGPGYALENRQIVSRVFPDLLNDAGVRSLAGFFLALREHLLLATPEGEVPLAVVLTPGAFNETYFEHAYLARQLGLPLVHGHDLSVRGDTLFLKTLAGLRRVHAILRRLDDDFCDPLELRGDSALGVPGLLGVARAGRVMLANALGSGVLESAAWMGFMPQIAERLLGEKLRLPSVATWWCGEPAALDHVLEHLPDLVIKPAFPNQRFEAIFGRDLTPDAQLELRKRLERRPHAYVAQERLAFSQAPVWRNGPSQPNGFAPRAMGIRVYAVATPTGYVVMPGGLARTSSDAADVVSMQRGGGSKDVWVLERGRRVAEEPPAAAGAAHGIARHDDLPSRLAENLYWLGRYSERCENKARLVRATLDVRANAAFWPTARKTCEHFTPMTLFEDPKGLGLKADLARLGWCASQARSQLSAENWRAIGVMQRDFQEAARAKRDVRETLDALLLSLAALAGYALDDMTQDNGWRMLIMGRRLERLQFFAELLSRRLQSGATPTQNELEWLLDIGDSTITYRTRYLSLPRLTESIDLLVFDQSNPRALAFQWHGIERTAVRLAASLGGVPDDALNASVTKVRSLQLAGLDGASPRAERARQNLAAQLEELRQSAARLSDRLSLKHFSLMDASVRVITA
jgi:uncharacterized circularly permuted ATP-grasp superfamily protein/uncharacterized alpha-E superfamily protein